MAEVNKKDILIALLNQANQDEDLRGSLCYEVISGPYCTAVSCVSCPFSVLEPANVLLGDEVIDV